MSEDSMNDRGIDCGWLVHSVYYLAQSMKMDKRQKTYRVAGIYRITEKLGDTIVYQFTSAHNLLCNFRMRQCSIEEFAGSEREFV